VVWEDGGSDPASYPMSARRGALRVSATEVAVVVAGQYSNRYENGQVLTVKSRKSRSENPGRFRWDRLFAFGGSSYGTQAVHKRVKPV
jgi:hypothetical protein